MMERCLYNGTKYWCRKAAGNRYFLATTSDMQSGIYLNKCYITVL